jgi:cell pole-organizing protein PopZ
MPSTIPSVTLEDDKLVIDDGSLVSPPTASKAAESFASLASAAAAATTRHLPVGDGSRTLEDLVKEALRPLLKEWLDANLSGIVERAVEREVARLASRAGTNPES